MDVLKLAQEGKIKRYFSVRNKINAPEIISHITQRASGTEPLFLEKADYLHMLGFLKHVAEKFKLKFFAFALMPNHVHFLFQLTKDNLSEAMRYIFGIYARNYFNKKYHRKGSLFCDRYAQAVCFDGIYLLAASLYIHLNAVRAGLVENYFDYRWSSWRVYCQDIKKETFIVPEPILSILDSNLKDARVIYRRLLKEAIDIDKEEILEDTKSLDKFKDKLLKKIKSMPEFMKKGKLENILKEEKSFMLNSELQKEIEKLRQKGSYRKPTDKKAIQFAIKQLVSRGFNKSQIASKLNISRKTVYSYMAK